MKIIFYECLLNVGDLLPEPNDRILYSYLVYKSIANADAIFTGGQFDKDTFSSYMNENESGIIRNLSIPKISSELSLSFNTVKSRLYFLEDRRLIKRYAGSFNHKKTDVEVKYIPGIGKSRFFELLPINGLNGMNRIVFSYLYAKARKTGYIITPDSKQRTEFGISRKYYQKIICELKQFRLIERTKEKYLKINV